MTASVKTAPVTTEATEAKVDERGVPAYLPVHDSSEGLQKLAKETGKLHLDISDDSCLCGCGGESKGRFQPGHDARLKGKLTRAAVAGVNMVLVQGEESQEATPRQFAELLNTTKYNWAEGLDLAVERAKEAEKAKEARREEVAARKAERKANAASKGRGKISLADFAK